MELDPSAIEVNQITDFNSYLQSIDVTDPLIIGLVVFHVGTLVTILLTRTFTNLQIFIFCCLLSLVYFSESINELAAQKWASFTRQQYFDSDGMFMSITVSMPVLLNCMLLIGLWLYESTQTMSRIKSCQAAAAIRLQNEVKVDNTKKTS
ncbi:transmembrane protein 18 [Culicoides brevitarsis]|uniref:transmembrane protein 18 n=1 Tax=Culicoides brevitarsis TaxID=469753 RepID=UPI00307B40C9